MAERTHVQRSVVASYDASSRTTPLDVLLLEQLQKLLRRADLGELVGHIRFLRKLGDLAEDGEILVGDFERGGDDQEKVVHRFAVDGVEIDAGELAAERDPQPVDGERAAVGNRDVVADPRRAERLAPLQHLHERLLGLLVEAEETDQFLQDVVLAAALQLEVDGVFGKKLAQAHVRSPVLETAAKRNEWLLVAQRVITL